MEDLALPPQAGGESPVKESEPSAQEHHDLTLEDVYHIVLDYSIPLLSGIFVSLIWANVNNDDYQYMFSKHHAWSPGSPTLFGHEVNISFLVNDIFMVFFFGLASAEVVEAFLPGGFGTLAPWCSNPNRSSAGPGTTQGLNPNPNPRIPGPADQSNQPSSGMHWRSSGPSVNILHPRHYISFLGYVW